VIITLSTVDFDIYGSVTAEGTIDDQAQRRTTVAKTLDGNVIIDDAGFNIGDIAMQITLTTPSIEDVDAIKRITRLYSDHRLACSSGVYRGVISRYYNDGRGNLRIDFEIENTETEESS